MTIASDAFIGADQPTHDTPPTLFSTPSRSGIGDARHRRWVSDPTDVMQALRAERNQKRDLSPDGKASAPKKHAADTSSSQPTPRQLPAALFDVRELDEDASDLSRKDGLVPMWTVEEDLLILKLVDTYGKRWSKIAAHLPGRTDNGVRNRWNRMQRAQVLRESRGAEAGYRCRRCGQPKRGHICAALTRVGEAPAGDELEEQAQALTRLAADKMRPPAVCVESSIESSSVDDFAQGSGVLSAEEQQQLSHLAAAADSIMKQFPPELSSRTSSFDEAGLDIDELLQRLQRHELDGEARVEESSVSAPPFAPTLLPKRTASADFFMDLDSMLEELHRGELQRHSLAHIGRGVSSPFGKRSSIRVHAS